MRSACQVVAEVLQFLKEKAVPGVTTRELDTYAEEYIRKAGCQPAFKGYQGYPATICISINEQIIHGIPANRRIEDGDLVSIDVGTIYRGYYGDGAATFLTGNVTEPHRLLSQVTEEALYKGIAQCTAGKRLGDLGWAIQTHAEKHGFAVVRDFVGHGIGTQMHEDPQVPNYGTPGHGMLLKEGMVLAVEPMINQFTAAAKILDDRWTAVTADGGYSAHFEHTVAITRNGPDILTRLSA